MKMQTSTRRGVCVYAAKASDTFSTMPFCYRVTVHMLKPSADGKRFVIQYEKVL